MSELLTPPLIGCVVLGALYARGARAFDWRAGCFAGALLVTVAALVGPLDDEADRLLVAHMGQHILLLFVAAPLFVMSGPVFVLMRGLPMAIRRPFARALLGDGRAVRLRLLLGRLLRPWPVFALFNLNLLVWHLPAPYDLALRSEAVHVVEHLTFLITGCLFWGQVLDSPPFRAPLRDIERVVYLFCGMMASWVLAVVLAFAPSPVYSAYVGSWHRPLGLTALSDQQVAAGLMWVPGSIPFMIAITTGVYAALGSGIDRERRRGRLTPEEGRTR
jgi:cytochrome c oxidase assembly factor CtaG